MRKNLAMILSIILALSILLSGCGKPASIVGSWKADVDLSDAINESMVESDESMEDYFNFKDLNITLLFSFNEDGTCKVTLDEESWETMAATLSEQMKEQIVPYMNDQLGNSGMSLDAVLALMGTTLDGLIDMMMAELLTEEVTSQFNIDGYYKTEGNLLYTGEEAGEFDEDEAVNFSLKGNELVLEASTMFGDAEIANALFPMTLERVK